MAEGRSDGAGETRKQNCQECGVEYDPAEYYGTSYYDGPYNYQAGCATHCLACWLLIPPDLMENAPRAM